MYQVVLRTFLGTIAIFVLLSSLFLNSILGVFYLTTLTLAEVSKLRASQEVVSKLKRKHKKTKNLAHKKFMKNTGKKLTASALSASTIGTVAVIATVAAFEIDDFCEQKKNLEEQESILNGRGEEDVRFDMKDCVRSAKAETEQLIHEEGEQLKQTIKRQWRDIKDLTSESLESTQQKVSEAMASASEFRNKWWSSFFD